MKHGELKISVEEAGEAMLARRRRERSSEGLLEEVAALGTYRQKLTPKLKEDVFYSSCYLLTSG
jgi:hypothetical protein